MIFFVRCKQTGLSAGGVRFLLLKRTPLFVAPVAPLFPFFHCRRALICLEVLSSCRCRVVYLKKQKCVQIRMHSQMFFVFFICLPAVLHSYSPQCIQESLHTVGRLLFQHLDAALHLPDTKTTRGIRERSTGSH